MLVIIIINKFLKMSNRRNLNKDNEPSLKIHIEPRGAYLEENFSSLARNFN